MILVTNSNEEDFGRLCDIAEQTLYFIVGKAVARSGVPYLQCFVSFPELKTFAQVKSLAGQGHVLPAIWAAGTIKYCQLCATVYECGRRSDVIE